MAHEICRSILLRYIPLLFVGESLLWGEYGYWRDLETVGVFSCNLLRIPSWSLTHHGAIILVPIGAGGMLVPSTVLCTIISRGRILTVGHISGYWKDTRPAGTFSCILYHYPSWNITNVGAKWSLGEHAECRYIFL